jgi:hypothetical protein
METPFLKQHSPNSYFKEFAEKEGLECHPWNHYVESGILPCRKQFHVEIGGGLPIRDKAMLGYRRYIQEAILSSGATIHDESKLGDEHSLSSFDFGYANGTVSGFFYTTSVVNHRGNVDIFIVMYEH